MASRAFAAGPGGYTIGTVEDVVELLDSQPSLPELPLKYETQLEFLGRIAKSCRYEVEHTANVALEHCKWRQKHQVDLIANQRLQTLLDLPTKRAVADFVECLPVVEHGVDGEGRGVIYFLAGLLDIKRAKQLCPQPDAIFKYLIWTRERSLARQRSLVQGSTTAGAALRPPPYYISILDCRHIKMSAATSSDFQVFLKQIVEVDGQYAGRIGKMYIVNVPFFFQMVWGVAKNWFGGEVEKKIQICTTGNQYQSLMQAMGGDEAKIPLDFEGKGPALPASKVFCTKINFQFDKELDQVFPKKKPTSLPPPQPVVAPSTTVAVEEEVVVAPRVLTPPPPTRSPSPEPSSRSTDHKEDDDDDDKDVERRTRFTLAANTATSASRQALLAGFEAKLAQLFTGPHQQQQAKRELKQELANAVLRMDDETKQFELDVMRVRARRRKEHKKSNKAAALSTEEQDGGVNVVKVFASEDEVYQELNSIREEREAWERAMAFAKNYIELQNADWADVSRALRGRLDRAMDENRALTKTVADSLHTRG